MRRSPTQPAGRRLFANHTLQRNARRLRPPNQRMKILLTLRQPLFPADTGGKVRSWNIFSRLAKRASIHAVSFADPVADAAPIRKMQASFESYTPVFWEETEKYSPKFYKELFTNQFSALPYFLGKCCLPHFRRTVETLLAKEPLPGRSLAHRGINPRRPQQYLQSLER